MTAPIRTPSEIHADFQNAKLAASNALLSEKEALEAALPQLFPGRNASVEVFETGRIVFTVTRPAQTTQE